MLILCKIESNRERNPKTQNKRKNLLSPSIFHYGHNIPLVYVKATFCASYGSPDMVNWVQEYIHHNAYEDG